MAAGQGFKTFTTGEVLSASDVNGYLMQGVLVFASATARDAAITSPQEGQFAYTKDTNGLWYYDGATWVASGATGDIEGVTAGVGISGGGTSGTVTITNSMATAIDAKGDLVVGTAADTFSRLAVGSNDTVLTADSTTATGLKWASPAASGGFTLISSTSLSGASVTVSSIPSTYTHLMVIFQKVFCNSNDYPLKFQLNGDTGGNYPYNSIYSYSGTVSASASTGNDNFQIFSRMRNAADTKLNLFGTYWIYDYTTSTNKGLQANIYSADSGGNTVFSTGYGNYSSSSAITSITAIAGGVNFSGGTMYVYGVK